MTAMKDWIQHEIDTARRHALLMELLETAIAAQISTENTATTALLSRCASERAQIAKEIAFAERMRQSPKP